MNKSPLKKRESAGPLKRSAGLTSLLCRGKLSLCLLLFALAGCSAKPELITVPQVVKLKPPALLMSSTPAPLWNGETNGDLLRYAQDLEESLAGANLKATKLREWAGD